MRKKKTKNIDGVYFENFDIWTYRQSHTVNSSPVFTVPGHQLSMSLRLEFNKFDNRKWIQRPYLRMLRKADSLREVASFERSWNLACRNSVFMILQNETIEYVSRDWLSDLYTNKCLLLYDMCVVVTFWVVLVPIHMWFY